MTWWQFFLLLFTVYFPLILFILRALCSVQNKRDLSPSYVYLVFESTFSLFLEWLSSFKYKGKKFIFMWRSYNTHARGEVSDSIIFLGEKRNKYYYLEIWLKEFQSYYKIKSTNSHFKFKFLFSISSAGCFFRRRTVRSETWCSVSWLKLWRSSWHWSIWLWEVHKTNKDGVATGISGWSGCWSYFVDDVRYEFCSIFCYYWRCLILLEIWRT